MKALLNVVSAALLLAPALAWSQAAVVEGVQMPAWVERGGARTPLSPGMRRGVAPSSGDSTSR